MDIRIGRQLSNDYSNLLVAMKRFIVPSDTESILHAHLICGDYMVMPDLAHDGTNLVDCFLLLRTGRTEYREYYSVLGESDTLYNRVLEKAAGIVLD
tara:strand:+ start:2013 stop:2303 length:291 start_codon:yes stop_codon:yes gene_type:complete